MHKKNSINVCTRNNLAQPEAMGTPGHSTFKTIPAKTRLRVTSKVCTSNDTKKLKSNMSGTQDIELLADPESNNKQFCTSSISDSHLQESIRSVEWSQRTRTAPNPRSKAGDSEEMA